MKILNSFGPNPRMVRMFLAEKGLKMDMVEHDLQAGENREPAYLNKNPGGQMPALELDDGTILAETVVICDYLEELYPTPALIGTNAQERAEARMWNRRIEQKITGNIYDGFQFAEGIDMFKNRKQYHDSSRAHLKNNQIPHQQNYIFLNKVTRLNNVGRTILV